MEELQKKIDNRINYLKSKYEIIGEGRSRIVFLKDENTVIKCPLNDWGMYHNRSEAQRFLTFGKDKDKDIIKYAECSLYYHDGIELLDMERIYPISKEETPEWAKWVDCGQVGKNKNGEIVAYDYP